MACVVLKQAHNDDKLGRIKVLGDLVKLSDIEQTAAPAYGIINDISDIKEALNPSVWPKTPRW